MSSSKSAEAQRAVSQNESVARNQFSIGLGAYQTRRDALYNSLLTKEQMRNPTIVGQLLGTGPGFTNTGTTTVGEPEYLTNAFAAQRGALTDQYLQNAQNVRLAGRAGQAGGESNPLMALSGEQLGQALARQISGSGTHQAGSRISQTLNLYNMAAGSAGQAGNASLGFAGNQIQAMSMMPNYNQTYANILGGVNAIGAGYGALNKAGAFNTGGGGLGQPLPGVGATLGNATAPPTTASWAGGS